MEKFYKSYKIRLYPTKNQISIIEKTFGCTRFIWNQMLNERIEIYDLLKNNKEELYSYKYNSLKDWKEKFSFLSEVPYEALNQAKQNLNQAYSNFFQRIKKGKKPGFPKFKSKKFSKDSFRQGRINSSDFTIENSRIKLMKIGKVKYRGNIKEGDIKSVTVSKSKSGKYFASVLVEFEKQFKKERISDNIIGMDLGLKEFAVCSNGEIISGIKEDLYGIEKKIKKQQKHLSRKVKGSNRYEKCRLKLAKLYEYKTNYLNHFQWHLVNKLCSENQAISLEDLNIQGMLKNRKLSHAIHNTNWGSFVSKLEQKAKEYGTEIYKVDRFFPSSKMCSKCGNIKQKLTLADREYRCSCGNKIDRDLNAAINIQNNFLINKKLEKYSNYRRGEIVRPCRLSYQPAGNFIEAFTSF